MPNYCYCSLSFEGDEKDINTLKKKLSSTNDKGELMPIDFNKVIPMPSELNISKQSDAELIYYQKYTRKKFTDHEIQMINEMSPERKEIALLLAKQYHSNRIKYGYPTWYKWRIQNWGTKWNAMQSDKCDFDTHSNAMYFMTAWSPPIPVLSQLACDFPKIAMTLKYFDQQDPTDITTVEFKIGKP